MLQRENVSKRADVYSFGILLFEIVAHQIPYADVIPLMVPYLVLEGKVGKRLTLKQYGFIATYANSLQKYLVKTAQQAVT